MPPVPSKEPAPAPAAQPKTEEKIDVAGVEQFLKGQIGDRYKDIAPAQPPPEPEKPAGDKEPVKEPDKKKPEKPEAKAKQPAKPFKPKALPERAPLTEEQIAAAAAEGATRALAASKPKGEGAEPPPPPQLTGEDQRRVEVLKRLEQLQPDKYKDIATKYTKSVVALEKYAEKWEKDHPGEKFDEEAPEHQDFLDKNDVDWSDMDFTEALADMRAEARMKEHTPKMEKQVEELQRAEKVRQAGAAIVQAQNSAATQFWQQAGEDMADVLTVEGSLNMKRAQELATADPEGWAIRLQAAKNLDVEVAELHKLFNGLAENDPKNNPVHREINRFAAGKEEELATKPTQDKLNADGQVFLPAAKYYALPKPDRARFWTFNADDLAALRAADLATLSIEQARMAEERHMAWARSRGIELEKPNAKPESPSAGGESRLAAAAHPAAKPESEVGNVFLRDHIGR